jgi:hypothetical protein
VTRPIAPSGPEWEWAAAVAPSPQFEGVTLATFLDRIASEHGWVLSYADTALAGEAARIVLHGSVDGLPPRKAIDVAIATSGLVHQFNDGELSVSRRTMKR